MDLRQLRFLIRTLESPSISRAARSLRITQPSLSQRLRELEEELGVTLLDRTPSGIRPTPAGLRVAERARAILRLADALIAEAGSDPREPVGDVAVGLPTTMALHLTVPLVKAVREAYPRVNLRVSEGMSGHIQEWVLSGRLDLAILYTDDAIDGLDIRKIVDEDLCLISKADPSRGADSVSFASLGRFPLVLPGPGHGLRRSIEAARMATRTTLSIAVEVDSLPHLKRLAMDGELHTILPHAACAEEIRAGLLQSRLIVRPNVRRPIVIASARTPTNALAVAKVHDMLDGLVRQSIGLGSGP